MPRLTLKGLADENKLLRNEIVQLEAQLHSREERSRSRHRKAQFKVEPISARTMRALDIVRKHDRDSVIEEQRATIAKQAQVNENLRLGGGFVRPILCSAFNFDENSICCAHVSAFRAKMLVRDDAAPIPLIMAKCSSNNKMQRN